MFSVDRNRLVVANRALPFESDNPLDTAIAKWEFIVDYIRTNNIPIYDNGALTCALCIHFVCHECPVGSKYGGGCFGTPYKAYDTSVKNYYNSLCDTPEHSQRYTQDALNAAIAELELLKTIKMEEE